MGDCDTRIELDGKGWRISVQQNNLTGITKAAELSFALGKNDWNIQEDPGCMAKYLFHI